MGQQERRKEDYKYVLVTKMPVNFNAILRYISQTGLIPAGYV